jgi:hypothetical protein
MIAVGNKTYGFDLKLFYSAVDFLIIFLVSFIFDIFFTFLSYKQPNPATYQKYIIKFVSNQTVGAESEPPDETLLAVPEDSNVWHRSNS